MRNITVTVAASGTDSNFARIGAETSCRGLVGIVTPAALTSTTLTIKPSLDGTTALTHADYTGSTFTIPCGASRWISLDPALFAGFPYVQIIMGSAEAAARTLTLMMTEVA